MAFDLKKKIQLTFLLIASFVSILSLFHSFIIYTSLVLCLPWFNPSGLQFIILWFPDFKVLMVIGFISIVFGKYFGVSFWTRLLPILSGCGILIIFFDQSLPSYLVTTGTPICIGFIILILYCTGKDIKNINISHEHIKA